MCSGAGRSLILCRGTTPAGASCTEAWPITSCSALQIKQAGKSEPLQSILRTMPTACPSPCREADCGPQSARIATPEAFQSLLCSVLPMGWQAYYGEAGLGHQQHSPGSPIEDISPSDPLAVLQAGLEAGCRTCRQPGLPHA